MKTLISLCTIILIIFVGCQSPVQKDSVQTYDYDNTVTLSKSDLQDKIKGGWAGQVIGCTYGGPTEFQYKGTMINDYNPIEWNEDMMLWYYENSPGLYDDIYMDLTFVDVFEREGIDAPASSHALAFANAEYMLWHANQSARYNILNGIMPPESGHWINNPHADDIDFQIEADFAGLMSPGMVNSSSEVCDKVGHIMNYGDGWYGGVYVAAMYSYSFISDDIQLIVNEALKAIPEESEFYQCMADVIKWHKEFPDDWKRNWFECQKKWSSDIGCPDGVFNAFNIDAKINAAYILIGLLYGDGDFGKTVDISTRCGQDSDCNPASAAGILGTVLGYNNIPKYWKQGLDKVEDLDFRYTTISLNDVYQMSVNQAIRMIENAGGTTTAENVTIKVQKPEPVVLEIGFEGHFPKEIIKLNGKKLDSDNKGFKMEFDGKGFVIRGNTRIWTNEHKDKVFEVDVYVDGELHEHAKLPLTYQARRNEITWGYNLEEGHHEVELKLLNPMDGFGIWLENCIVYKSS